MVELINFDQTGSIRGRLAPDKEETVLSLNAEKAFDRLELPYLCAVMKHLGFGPKFVSMIQILYETLLTTLPLPFPLQRVTQQGCPPSTLLFALSLESHSQTIREHKFIYPIFVHGSKSRFLRMRILFFSNFKVSISQVFSVFNDYKKLAGYPVSQHSPFWDSQLNPSSRVDKAQK